VFDNNTIVLDITPEKSSSGRLSLFALLVLFLLMVLRMIRLKYLVVERIKNQVE